MADGDFFKRDHCVTDRHLGLGGQSTLPTAIALARSLGACADQAVSARDLVGSHDDLWRPIDRIGRCNRLDRWFASCGF